LIFEDLEFILQLLKLIFFLAFVVFEFFFAIYDAFPVLVQPVEFRFYLCT